MLEVNNNSIIYVTCPPLFATGGTELLHQLCYKLNKLGFKSLMYYRGEFTEDPVSDRFKKYNVDYVWEVPDKQENIVILPEVAPRMVYDFKNITKVIWWLSVDNYFDGTTYTKRKIKKYLFGKKFFDIKNPDPNVYHFVQSEYARQFLMEHGITKIFFLSDYLNKSFLENEYSYTSNNRENRVLYNPKKGFEFVKQIMESASDISFVALENMTPDEIIHLTQTSKVYIDFGNHPGKDRFPREAAIGGCCIITGKKGSAKYYEDVPINNEYKFENDTQEIPLIINKIQECFKNYDSKISDFENYRKFILSEEGKFEQDIQLIFKKI
jgi:hypothetical protein